MSFTRRSYFTSIGTAVGVGLAGCLGGSSQESGDTVESLPPPVQGDPDADVTVMVFEDFACPHCRQFSLEVLPQLESAYIDPGNIRYEHHDFPIPVDERWSWTVPSAARGVQDTTDDATFFEYTHALFENQSRYSLDLIVQLADDVGADGSTIRQVAETQRYRPVIEADRELGNEMNLAGTPQIYVNGKRLNSYAYESITRAIESAR